MKGQESRRSLAHDPGVLADAEDILTRYPEVSSEERARIGHFLSRGAPIDVGLLSSNAELWRRAERFKGDHPEYFKIGKGVYAGWIAAVIGIMLVLVLIKDMGVH